MSTKSKIGIILIILSIVLFGIALNGLAFDTNSQNLNELAWVAIYNRDDFMNTSVNELVNRNIFGGANQKELYYKSGICMYHNQSNKDTGDKVLYKITDILDFNFNENGMMLYKNGVYQEYTNETTAMLAKALYEAYSGIEQDYVENKNQAYNMKKQEVRSAFINAISNYGITAEEAFYTGITQKSNEYYGDISKFNEYGVSAKNYKAVTKNSQDSEIIVQHESTSEQGYTVIGPFNINFAGKYINKIDINSEQKQFTDWNNGQIYYSTVYTTADGVATKIANGDSGWSNILSNIPSDINFYIAVPDKYEEFNKGNNLKVIFNQQGMEYYYARLILALNPQATGQNFGIYAAEQKYYDGKQIFNIENRPVDLTVVKYGKDNIRQANVNFRLGNGELNAIWGNKEEQDGVMVYSNITFGNWEDTDKQIFTTGSTGKFIIKDLNTTYTYLLQETWNSNAGYSVVNIKNAILSNGVASVVLGNTVETNRKTNNLVTGIKLSSTQANVLEITDKKEEEPDDFNIKINKTKLNGTTYLSGAEFKIKVLDKNGNVIGWLEKDSNGKYVYDSEYADATKWCSTYSKTTKKGYVYAPSTNGKIEITGLSTEYQYEIYETKVGSGGYALSSQITSVASSSMSVKIDGTKVKDIEYIEAVKTSKASNDYAPTDASIICGKVSYDENDTTTVTVLVTNRTRSTGGGRRWRKLFKLSIY